MLSDMYLHGITLPNSWHDTLSKNSLPSAANSRKFMQLPLQGAQQETAIPDLNRIRWSNVHRRVQDRD